MKYLAVCKTLQSLGGAGEGSEEGLWGGEASF